MFTLTIKTDNDAFDDDPAPEVARILRRVAVRIENGGWTSEPVFDINGHNVGSYDLFAADAIIHGESTFVHREN